MKIVSKEGFMQVWKETSRDNILNQFYYEHKALMEEYEKQNNFRKWLIDYRYNKTGSHEDGRYCVAISVTDLLKKLDELESKND